MPLCSEVPYRHLVMPVFFRLLYCTGMRFSEARLLKIGDVNLANGVITVANAKPDKHRQLPLSPEMLMRLVSYHENVHMLSKQDNWFFLGYSGKGPRVHDFRHTFAVHCLRRWVLEGKNINAYIPVLQAYLGHVEFSDTAYYLHLISPNI